MSTLNRVIRGSFEGSTVRAIELDSMKEHLVQYYLARVCYPSSHSSLLQDAACSSWDVLADPGASGAGGARYISIQDTTRH